VWCPALPETCACTPCMRARGMPCTARHTSLEPLHARQGPKRTPCCPRGENHEVQLDEDTSGMEEMKGWLSCDWLALQAWLRG
jgi:hypothetical protein